MADIQEKDLFRDPQKLAASLQITQRFMSTVPRWF
jgi:hypothetical protein